jgi:hypothetical protein
MAAVRFAEPLATKPKVTADGLQAHCATAPAVESCEVKKAVAAVSSGGQLPDMPCWTLIVCKRLCAKRGTWRQAGNDDTAFVLNMLEMS